MVTATSLCDCKIIYNTRQQLKYIAKYKVMYILFMTVNYNSEKAFSTVYRNTIFKVQNVQCLNENNNVSLFAVRTYYSATSTVMTTQPYTMHI